MQQGKIIASEAVPPFPPMPRHKYYFICRAPTAGLQLQAYAKIPTKYMPIPQMGCWLNPVPRQSMHVPCVDPAAPTPRPRPLLHTPFPSSVPGISTPKEPLTKLHVQLRFGSLKRMYSPRKECTGCELQGDQCGRVPVTGAIKMSHRQLIVSGSLSGPAWPTAPALDAAKAYIQV